jgi:hypothetical protein
MGWMIGVLGFVGAGNFCLYHHVQNSSGATQTPVQWLPGAFSLGVKWLGHEADHSPPSSAEVKNAWSYTSTPSICLHGVVLSKKKKKKHRDNFTFTFYTYEKAIVLCIS